MTAREAELTQQPEQALQVIASLRRENELLRQKIDLLVRRVFGVQQRRVRTQRNCNLLLQHARGDGRNP